MVSCGILVSRRDIVGGEDMNFECIRGENHDGPHLILQAGGAYIIWDTDLCPPGECEDCDREDPVDYCLVYRQLTSALELQKYLYDPRYTGK